jgi:crossover junction endodeoxyribonuclease RuvC
MSKANLQATIILGIDPGYADLGYGVISCHNSGLKYLTCDNIQSNPKEKMPERLLCVSDALSQIMVKFKPDIVAIEKLFFFKNQKTAMNLAQSRGVVMLLTAKHKIPIVEFTPPQIKQSLTSHGQASKQQVAHMVMTLLNVKNLKKKDDAIDALATAICAAWNIKI